MAEVKVATQDLWTYITHKHQALKSAKKSYQKGVHYVEHELSKSDKDKGNFNQGNYEHAKRRLEFLACLDMIFKKSKGAIPRPTLEQVHNFSDEFREWIQQFTSDLMDYHCCEDEDNDPKKIAPAFVKTISEVQAHPEFAEIEFLFKGFSVDACSLSDEYLATFSDYKQLGLLKSFDEVKKRVHELTKDRMKK